MTLNRLASTYRLASTDRQIESLGRMANDLHLGGFAEPMSRIDTSALAMAKFIEGLFDVVIGVYGLERCYSERHPYEMSVQPVPGSAPQSPQIERLF